MQAFLYLVAAIADRLRGRYGGIVKLSMKFVLGYLVSIVYGYYFGWISLGLTVAVGVGYSIGWGVPLSAALAGYTNSEKWQEELGKPGNTEGWQKDILKKSVILALIIRGGMIGLPALLLLYLVPTVYYIGLTAMLAMPASAFMGAAIGKYTKFEYSNTAAELIRGGLWLALLYATVRV